MVLFLRPTETHCPANVMRRDRPVPWRLFLRPLVLAVVAGGLLLSCSDLGSDGAPVSEDTFRSLVVELHLWSKRAEVTDTVSHSLRDSIFARYGTTEADFQEAFRHYAQQPEVFNDLYDQALDTLNSIRGRLRNRDQSPLNVDSLRRAAEPPSPSGRE